jgi:hypothetical protein
MTGTVGEEKAKRLTGWRRIAAEIDVEDAAEAKARLISDLRYAARRAGLRDEDLLARLEGIIVALPGDIDFFLAHVRAGYRAASLVWRVTTGCGTREVRFVLRRTDPEQSSRGRASASPGASEASAEEPVLEVRWTDENRREGTVELGTTAGPEATRELLRWYGWVYGGAAPCALAQSARAEREGTRARRARRA